MDQHSGQPLQYDEFSPKKFILQTRDAGRYIVSKWKKIILISILFGIIGATYSFFKKPTYRAEITFALDEGAADNINPPVTNLGEQLGLDYSMEAGGVFSSPGNIVELMQSRLLIEKTLRNSITVKGKPIVFADFFLDSLDYRDDWMKKSAYYNLNFLSPEKDQRQILFESGLIQNIYEILTKKIIKIEAKGKGTTIISVGCICKNESFAKYFLEAWMDEVTRYYIETKTQRAKLNLQFIQHRADSVRDAYNSSLFGRAIFSDSHMNPARQRSYVSGEKQQTDVQILKTSYIELARSLEAAKTVLMRDTPLIQYLDRPILPLKKASSSMLKYFVIFFVAAMVLSSFWFLTGKIIKQILAR